MANDWDALADQKQIAFYGAVVAAWVETRMEKDKTLLSLSTGGIGLLVTLLTTIGPSSGDELWWYGAAGAFFVAATLHVGQDVRIGPEVGEFLPEHEPNSR